MFRGDGKEGGRFPKGPFHFYLNGYTQQRLCKIQEGGGFAWCDGLAVPDCENGRWTLRLQMSDVDVWSGDWVGQKDGVGWLQRRKQWLYTVWSLQNLVLYIGSITVQPIAPSDTGFWSLNNLIAKARSGISTQQLKLLSWWLSLSCMLGVSHTPWYTHPHNGFCPLQLCPRMAEFEGQ